MLQQRRTRAALLRAALFYGTELHWPVAPGAYLNGGVCSCGDPYCTRPGQHPAEPGWYARASSEEQEIRDWWLHAPHTVLIAVGAAFDVLDVPVRVGTDAMRELASAGRACGPVLATGQRRLQFLVRPHAGDLFWHTLEQHGAREVDIRHAASGSHVVVPPSGNQLMPGALWAAPPDPVTLMLPDAGDLLGTLLHCAGASVPGVVLRQSG
jgi:hypothetical protein